MVTMPVLSRVVRALLFLLVVVGAQVAGVVHAGAAGGGGREYVVSFHDYHPFADHLSLVLRGLPVQCEGSHAAREVVEVSATAATTTTTHQQPCAVTWQLVSRSNQATSFPSDFALVQLEGPLRYVHQLVRRLEGVPAVKHVHRNRLLRVSLSSSGSTPPASKPHASRRSRREQSQKLHFAGGRGSVPEPLVTSGDDMPSAATATSRKLLSVSVADSLEASVLWDKGYTGTGVKVAVFDTGLRGDHPHFKNICERTNWTNERFLDDRLISSVGHGTFVAGIIASRADCKGFAPDADLYIFRVFTSAQASYTAWFLDAFNYAMHVGVHVLNLSIGGPDFNDRPFMDKVWEVTANGIIIVSAIGNDGPLYGTLNNPADHPDVIGVGGVDSDGTTISRFSSRGMTTWELPWGYGRVKPDVVAYADRLRGSDRVQGCATLSGTSVASPVVAGAVTLLASVVPESLRWRVLNPASMKQVLVESATRLPHANIFEQGAGRINLREAVAVLTKYTPRASAFPATLDLTDCPYMWPYCSQPLYHGAMPIMANVTILNGMSVAGEVVSARWEAGVNGDKLDVTVTASEVVWPWTGYLGVGLQVPASARDWSGIAQGVLEFVVESIPDGMQSSVRVPVTASIVPTPPREKRILFDQFHSLRYPSGYFPRDNLDVTNDVLDWNADHLHTNFRDLYTHIRELGLFVEVLSGDWTCFNASNYGTLLVVDTEEEFFPAEVAKLQDDVMKEGLSVLVLADWYNVGVIDKARFFDVSTRSWWTPVTGGSNVPALNDVLSSFGIALGSRVYTGNVHVGSTFSGLSTKFASGNALIKFPAGGWLSKHALQDQSTLLAKDGGPHGATVPVVGALRLPGVGAGRVAVYGDSNLVDSAHSIGFAWWLFDRLVAFTARGVLPDDLFPPTSRLSEDYVSQTDEPPLRRKNSGFEAFSRVASGKVQVHAQCNALGPDAARLVQGQGGASSRRGHADIDGLEAAAASDDGDELYADAIGSKESDGDGDGSTGGLRGGK